MTQQKNIQHAGCFTDGNAARQMETAPSSPRPVRRSRPRRSRVLLVHVDFLALTGILIALVMLVMMTVEFVQLVQISRRTEKIRTYVEQLETEYRRLDETYHAGYDPEEIRSQALAMGMIPASQAQVIQLP